VDRGGLVGLIPMSVATIALIVPSAPAAEKFDGFNRAGYAFGSIAGPLFGGFSITRPGGGSS